MKRFECIVNTAILVSLKLTYSVEKSPSWEANRFLPSQEITNYYLSFTVTRYAKYNSNTAAKKPRTKQRRFGIRI
jgi:hypothetical protein